MSLGDALGFHCVRHIWFSQEADEQVCLCFLFFCFFFLAFQEDILTTSPLNSTLLGKLKLGNLC